MTSVPTEPDPIDPVTFPETDPDGNPIEEPDPEPVRREPRLDPIAPGAPH